MNHENQIKEAVAVLKKGGLVAFPTETVYGLGADANNDSAVKNIFIVKKRPVTHPLIVHLARLEQMVDWVKEVTPHALTLAQRFWPGPLTLILKKNPNVLDAVTGAQPTIALRVPKHPVAQALLDAFDSGIAAPSANLFTHVSPTDATAVYQELGNNVDLILDGGDCEVGLESTIVDVSADKPTILRPGAITADALEHALQAPVYFAQSNHGTRAPGSHALHYAPQTPVNLFDVHDVYDLVAYLVELHLPVVFLLRSDIKLASELDVIAMPKDAKQYAHVLYKILRQCDQKNYKQIFIEKVPIETEWLAVHDRLTKAANKA